MPVGTYLSTGNEADVGFEEALGELVDDTSVDLVLAYAEGIRDGAGSFGPRAVPGPPESPSSCSRRG